MARLRVSQQPASSSTGDELVEPRKIQDWQLRRSIRAVRRPAAPRIRALPTITCLTACSERLKQHLDTYQGLDSFRWRPGRFDLVPAALPLRRPPGVPQGGPAARPRSAPDRMATRSRVPRQPRIERYTAWPVMCCRRWTRHGDTPRGLTPGEKIALAAPVSLPRPLAGFLPAAAETDEWGSPWAVAIMGPITLRTAGYIKSSRPDTYPKVFVTRLYRW